MSQLPNRMANRFSLINEIKAGRVDWKIKVRVISLWTPYDFKNPGVISSMEMILADEKVKFSSEIIIS